MIELRRTNSSDAHFIELVTQLDQYLTQAFGTKQKYYDQFNSVNKGESTVVAYLNDIPVGCGCLRKFNSHTVEVKRMFVRKQFRRKGIAEAILADLEKWAVELGFGSIILETGTLLTEAIEFYKKHNYLITEKWSPYVGVETSICMKKKLNHKSKYSKMNTENLIRIKRTKWTERVFNFDVPLGLLPNVLERLRGTHPRLIAISEGLSKERLTQVKNNKWSIQEHIGHLADLEKLHFGRLSDFEARKEMLRPADMSNAETNFASHNENKLSMLLETFQQRRSQFVECLSKYDEATHNFQCLHPRLKVRMKPIDMAIFIAEHDDHHLASIREIIILQNNETKNVL